MGARGPAKYRDMLMMTAIEELSHIEFLGHAVELNLQDAPTHMQDDAAKYPVRHTPHFGHSKLNSSILESHHSMSARLRFQRATLHHLPYSNG